VEGRLREEEEGKMKCPLCKGKMVTGKTNLPYELDGEKIIVVRNVPALVCDQCGDAFVEIDILRKVEEVIARAERDGMTMGFAEYEKAA
jgi:YgiT-type zinc finger domain-containing protein